MSNPRIIGGTARGLRLRSTPGDSTRPITDRVKEALFNILAPDLFMASFLDLFGGTGSVGIEALSRGAAFTRFVDLNQRSVDIIRENLSRARLQEKSEVIQSDAFSVLSRNPDRTFDYIYIAPPQYKELWIQAIRKLNENPGWMAEDAWVVVQIDPKEYQQVPAGSIVEFDQRRYGRTLLVFYERIKSSPAKTITSRPSLS